MATLRGKTLFITGATRGIGLAIALRAARDGANVVVVGKTDRPHPQLSGTVYTAVNDIENAGGTALACVADIRFEDQVAKAVEGAVAAFGGIDILINNASAISLADTSGTSMKRFDLMHQVNTRGTFLCSKLCLPHLEMSPCAHILNLSPPLNMRAKWFAPHVAYTMAKYGMSMCVLGMAEELRGRNIAVNALWPRTAIATAAIEMLMGEKGVRGSRKPEIVADAVHVVVTRDPSLCTGNFFIDDEVLTDAGVRDFTPYAVDPAATLLPDFFLEPQ
ncbi:MAG: NAD(P)-dependent oxidoreductase [Nannocystaceae bacterium]